MSGTLAPQCRCYAALFNGNPVGFIAVMHVHMNTRYFRVSRLVVLPDFQGIGIGKKLLNFVAELYTSQLKVPFYILTTNPQIIRGNLDCWNVKRVGHTSIGRGCSTIDEGLRRSVSRNRFTASLQYKPKQERGSVSVDE